MNFADVRSSAAAKAKHDEQEIKEESHGHSQTNGNDTRNSNGSLSDQSDPHLHIHIHAHAHAHGHHNRHHNHNRNSDNDPFMDVTEVAPRLGQRSGGLPESHITTHLATSYFAPRSLLLPLPRTSATGNSATTRSHQERSSSVLPLSAQDEAAVHTTTTHNDSQELMQQEEWTMAFSSFSHRRSSMTLANNDDTASNASGFMAMHLQRESSALDDTENLTSLQQLAESLQSHFHGSNHSHMSAQQILSVPVPVPVPAQLQTHDMPLVSVPVSASFSSNSPPSTPLPTSSSMTHAHTYNPSTALSAMLEDDAATEERSAMLDGLLPPSFSPALSGLSLNGAVSYSPSLSSASPFPLPSALSLSAAAGPESNPNSSSSSSSTASVSWPGQFPSHFAFPPRDTAAPLASVVPFLTAAHLLPRPAVFQHRPPVVLASLAPPLATLPRLAVRSLPMMLTPPSVLTSTAPLSAAQLPLFWASDVDPLASDRHRTAWALPHDFHWVATFELLAVEEEKSSHRRGGPPRKATIHCTYLPMQIDRKVEQTHANDSRQSVDSASQHQSDSALSEAKSGSCREFAIELKCLSGRTFLNPQRDYVRCRFGVCLLFADLGYSIHSTRLGDFVHVHQLPGHGASGTATNSGPLSAYAAQRLALNPAKFALRSNEKYELRFYSSHGVGACPTINNIESRSEMKIQLTPASGPAVQ